MGFLRKIYWQVLIAIALGAIVGAVWPASGAAMKPLGDGFIALIRMMIGPVIFCTIVHGIGSMHDMAKVGRIGLKAILWFEFISTFALILGLIAAHLTHPGVGMATQVVPLSREYFHTPSPEVEALAVMAMPANVLAVEPVVLLTVSC